LSVQELKLCLRPKDLSMDRIALAW